MGYVSRNPLNPDSIKVDMNKHLFKDPVTGKYIDTDEVLQEDLPRQIDPVFAQEFEDKVE